MQKWCYFGSEGEATTFADQHQVLAIGEVLGTWFVSYVDNG